MLIVAPMHDDFDPDAPALSGDPLFGLPFEPDDAAVVVVPVPFEATTSFGRGTAHAPQQVLDASVQVDLHDTDAPGAWRSGIAMLPIPKEMEAWCRSAATHAAKVIQAGGAQTTATKRSAQAVDAICERVNSWTHEQTARLLDAGKIPAILGGDHSVPFGAMKAAFERHAGMGILHVDAHADLRDAYQGFIWSHASILHNVCRQFAPCAVSQVGLRDLGEAEHRRIQSDPALHAIFDRDVRHAVTRGIPWIDIVDRALAPLPEHVWITFDVDGLQPSLAPNTGTPVPGGLDWHQTLVLLEETFRRHHVVGFDIVEVGNDPWDANVAARLLYKMAGWAIQHRA